jgi:hypothetical protein
VLVAACCALALPDSSPLVPKDGGRIEGDATYAWAFLVLLALAFAAYVGGLWALTHARARRAAVVAIAVGVQVVPFFAPQLLSTDPYTYWVYGDIARAYGNPYRDEPREFPNVPGYDEMGEKWRDQTSVYGPAFTFASEAVGGSRPGWASALFKLAATVAMVAVVLLVARHSTFAAAFAGWNPVVAVHIAGGGHNDAWMIALVVGALTLGATGRRQAAGVAWALSILVKWIPLVLLPLRALEARATGRRVGHVGFALTAIAVGALATWQFGLYWLRAVAPIAQNAGEMTSYSLPHRLSQLGVPENVAIALGVAGFAAAYVWLARQALAGRARLGLAMGILLLCVPYVTPWYLAWVVPLAAIEEDRTARVLALGLTAYLLPQTIPV